MYSVTLLFGKHLHYTLNVFKPWISWEDIPLVNLEVSFLFLLLYNKHFLIFPKILDQEISTGAAVNICMVG